MRTAVLLSLSVAGLGMAASTFAQSSAADAAPQINRVIVELESTRGQRASGSLSLSPDNQGLHIQGTIRGLKANSEHGFHVHENGDCSAPDASSAGGHFNPAGAEHGRHGQGTHHAGDMPNLVANGQGEAEVDVHLAGLTLGDGGANDVLERAVIVHADPDDYASQPAGNAGARIACGVITRPEPVQLAPVEEAEAPAESGEESDADASAD